MRPIFQKFNLEFHGRDEIWSAYIYDTNSPPYNLPEKTGVLSRTACLRRKGAGWSETVYRIPLNICLKSYLVESVMWGQR